MNDFEEQQKGRHFPERERVMPIYQPPDHNVVWAPRLTPGRLLSAMQVPPDLASQLSSVAVLSGRSPDACLREAIIRLIESTARTLVPFEETPQHAGFVPQPQGFSVYE